MAYYDALVAKWATLSGTTAQKLAAINALTVAGPNQDVPVGTVVGYLALQGKLSGLQAYVVSTPPPAATPLTAAKELLTLLSTPSVTVFQMSVPSVYSAVEAFLDALAADPNSGIVSADVAALLALAAGPEVLWTAANGYPPGGINMNDLVAAGGLV